MGSLLGLEELLGKALGNVLGNTLGNALGAFVKTGIKEVGSVLGRSMADLSAMVKVS